MDFRRDHEETLWSMRVLKNLISSLVKKASDARLRRELSRAAHAKPASGGILRQYVGVSGSRATLIQAC